MIFPRSGLLSDDGAIGRVLSWPLRPQVLHDIGVVSTKEPDPTEVAPAKDRQLRLMYDYGYGMHESSLARQ
eukprot:scaffold9589_cov17-Prasinocladus_malaysianus.AAC.1